MKQSHLILSNALAIWACRVLLLVPQLILVPYLIATIGEAGYGVYTLVWSLLVSIEQLQRSLQSGVVKYSAGFLAQERIDDVNRVVSSSFIYSLLLAVVACTGILGAAALYDNTGRQIGSALIVVCVMVFFIMPLTPYVAVIQSRQRYYVEAIAEIIAKYLGLGTTFAWFAWMTPSVKTLIIIMAGTLLLSRIAQVPVAYKLLRGLQNRPCFFDKGIFRMIATFGAATVLASLCLIANSTGVRWLMGILVSTSFVAHLAIMLMPGTLLSQIVTAMTITIMPATSAYEATGNQRMLEELMIQSMRYVTILALAAVLTAGLLMSNVLRAWVGPEYVFLSPYALILFTCLSFMLSTSTAHHMLKGMGKLRNVVFIYFVGLLVVPITSILVLFYILKNPYVAVSFGLSAGYIVCGCLQIAYCTQAVRANFWVLLRTVYARSIMLAAIVYLVAISALTTIGICELPGRICAAPLAILLFCSGCYFFIATAAERQQIKGIFELVKAIFTLNTRQRKEA